MFLMFPLVKKELSGIYQGIKLQVLVDGVLKINSRYGGRHDSEKFLESAGLLIEGLRTTEQHHEGHNCR